MENNKFFNFIKPVLDFVDNGSFYRKPFSWLYVAFAALNIFFPFFILYQAINSGVFSYLQGKAIFLFILVFLLILFAAWIGFQIWWNRKDQVSSTSVVGDDFIAIPVFAHFIQTLGEWSGAMIAILGTGVSLLVFLFGGGMLPAGLNSVDLLGMGAVGIFIAPIYAFLTVVVARVTAELIRALASIANNTAKK